MTEPRTRRDEAALGRSRAIIGSILVNTLRFDNADVHENVAEKQTSHAFKLFRDYPNSPCYFKEENFGWS